MYRRGGGGVNKSSSRPFLAHSGGGQENFLYLRVAYAKELRVISGENYKNT